MNLREIITSYKESDIVKPELQRKYVWDKKSASRFIESILLGLPVPSLFFAKTSDSRMLIVDGYQRIKTICDFFDGIWTGDNSPFQLTNSDRINQRWRNKSYRDLSEEDQRRFKMYTIHAIIFEQKHPQNDSGLYQIFERINTSGMALNAQEIRNCVFQGKMNNLLFSLNDYPVWRELFGDLRPNSRMLDIEFILRFFAISQTEILQSTAHSISLKKVLNDYMSAYISGEDSFFEAKGEEFKRCIDFLNDKFGKDLSDEEKEQIENQINSWLTNFGDEATLLQQTSSYFGVSTMEGLKEYLSIQYIINKAVEEYVKENISDK